MEKYGPYGSKLEENYNFQLKDGEHITAVIVHHGYVVDAIGFVVTTSNGETLTKIFGGSGGNHTRIALKADEFITQITGTYGNYSSQANNGIVIATIKIHTNENPSGYGPYGANKVTNIANFASPSPKDNDHIVGIFGRHGNYLESIGVFIKNADSPYDLTTNIKNLTKREVHMLETHFWHGKSNNNDYPSIPTDGSVKLHQTGSPPEGVKWGIAYADGTTTSARKFIIAVDGVNQKIYAEAGPIGPIDWDVVQVKLDQYSKNTAEYEDPILGGKIVAEISGTNAVATFSN